MTAKWYYAVEGRTHGPVSKAELRQRASRGELCATDLVWRDGMEDWATAESLDLPTIHAPPLLQTSQRATSPAGSEPPLIDSPPITPPPFDAAQVAPPSIAPPPIDAAPVDPALAAMPRNRAATHPDASLKNAPRQNLKRNQAQASNSFRLGQPTTRMAILIVGVVSVVIGGFLIGHELGKRQGHDEAPSVIAPASVTNSEQKMHSDAPPITAGPTANPADTQADRTQPDDASVGLADAALAPRVSNPPPEAPKGFAGVSKAKSEQQPTDDVAVRAIKPRPPNSASAVGPNAAVGQPESAVATPAGQGAHVLFQTLEIHRTPTFEMPGITLAQEMRYRIVSRMEVSAHQADGKRQVVQIVESTHLDHADDLSRAALAKSLAALQNQQYTFTLNGHNEVIETSRAKTEAAATPVTLASSKGFQLTSVIDDDGWKELAQLTFFRPDEGVTQGDSFVRQMTHDWTPLGAWSGTTTFTGGAVREESQAIRFQHALSYTPPKPNPTPKTLSGSLPFRVVAADCTIDQANGVIEFDRRRERVSSASETFHVHGTITAELAGQSITITLKEQQVMTVRVSDQRPDSG